MQKEYTADELKKIRDTEREIIELLKSKKLTHRMARQAVRNAAWAVEDSASDLPFE